MYKLVQKFFHHFSNKPDFGKSNLLNVKTGVLSGLAIGIIVSILYYANFFEKLEAISMDFRFEFRQNPPLSKDLVVVGISKKCIDNIGGYPISRNIYAQIINYISQAGAKSIAFDIFFDLPSTEKDADMNLAKSIESSSRITLPIFSAQKVESLPIKDNMYTAKIMRHNLDIFTKASARQGHINILPGSDGKIRFVPAVFQYKENYVFPMAMEAYLQFKNIPHENVIVNNNKMYIKDQMVPLTSRKALLVNYFNPANAIDFLHLEMPGEKFANGINFFYFKDVLNGSVSPSYFKNKLVLIGQTSHGFSNSDEYITPFGVMFGAFIQASVINSFLTDNFVYRIEPTKVIMIIMAASILVGFLFSILSFSKAGVSCGLLFLAGYVVSFWVFNTKGLITETIPLTAVTIVNFSLHLIKRFQYAFKVILEKEVELGIISSAGEKLLDIYRVSDTPEMIINNITESISVDVCLLYICENNHSENADITLKAEKISNFSEKNTKDELKEMMKQINTEIRINKDPILINDFDKLAEANDSIDTGIKSLLIVPLIVHQEIIGIICLCNKWNIYKKASENFTNDDLKLLKSLLMQSAISLENYL
ncbi:CHASE2 domain-containing protein, partial [bacterium]|nr:CHASE2 domain-containing protein [bacterium]